MTVTPPKTPGSPSLVALSGRERDVLRLLVRFRQPAEIAVELGLTESTVRTYILWLARGAGVRGRLGLMEWHSENPGVLDGGLAYTGLRRQQRCPVVEELKAA